MIRKKLELDVRWEQVELTSLSDDIVIFVDYFVSP